MDTELTKWFATLGVGGAMAGVIFYFYHKLAMKHEENWQVMVTKLEQISDKFVDILEKNTVAFTDTANDLRGLKTSVERWDGTNRRRQA